MFFISDCKRRIKQPYLVIYNYLRNAQPLIHDFRPLILIVTNKSSNVVNIVPILKTNRIISMHGTFKNCFLNPNKNRRVNGFSLLELMFVMVIAVILGALAAPNLNDLIKNNRISTRTNDIIAMLGLARQVAVSRGLTVTACHSNNADLSSPSCDGGTSSNWGTGFLVYSAAEGTRSSTLDDYSSSSDSLIEQVKLESNGVTVVISNTADHLSFSNQGLLRPSGSLNFLVCDDRTGETGVRLSVTTSGSVNTTSTTCT